MPVFWTELYHATYAKHRPIEVREAAALAAAVGSALEGLAEADADAN